MSSLKRIRQGAAGILLFAIWLLTCLVLHRPQPEHLREFSMERLLRTSLLPVGQTMYIWGGGWNQDDAGAGIEAVTLGVSKRWAEYAAWQTEQYDFIRVMMAWTVPVISAGCCIMYFIPEMAKPAMWLVRRRWHAPVRHVAGAIWCRETTDRVIYAVWKGMSG